LKNYFATLEDAQQWLEKNRMDGVKCPCCNQFVKVYKRKFHGSMGRVLMLMCRAHWTGKTDDDGYTHVENLLVALGNNTKGVQGKMKYWGLVESKPPATTDKKTSGLWRPTHKGFLFAQNRVRVPKHVYVYNDSVLGFGNELVYIREVLPEKFNYQELMDERHV